MSSRHKGIAVDYGMDDIFSRLPRNLIDNILERMPIRDATRTSILSRKWRYIWCELPHLVLDKHLIVGNAHQLFYRLKFMSTINQILLLHRGPILKFVLYIPKTSLPCDWDTHIAQWILFLSRNGIKELNLDNSNADPVKLPSSVFSCPELRHLKVRNCVFRLPDAVCEFRYLTSLFFKKIAFSGDLFATCVPRAPLLERLNFTGCTGIEHFNNLHAPKLKNFIAIDSSDVKSIRFQKSPNLTFLCIVPGKNGEYPRQDRTINLSKFLDNFPGISKLRLDGFFLKLLDAGNVQGRFSISFNHLRHLVLHEIRLADLDQMSCVLCVLRNSPNLRKVDIKASSVREDVMVVDFSCLEAPDCMNQKLKQLRTMKMTSISGLRAELHFIKYILANSPKLETVLVQYTEAAEANKGFRISTELMRFSRASRKARIVYVEREVI